MARLFEPTDITGFDAGDSVSQFEEQTVFSPDLGDTASGPSYASEFQKGLIRGGANLKTGYADFGRLLSEAAGTEDVTSYLADISEKTAQETARFQPRVKSLADAESAEDYFDFLVGGTAESLPFLATTIGGGGIAGAIAKRAGAAQKGVRAAQVGGAFTSVAAPETGFTYSEIEHETGDKRPGLALAAGAAKGALDVFALGKNLQTFLPKGLRKGAAPSVLRDIAKTAAIEGSTEAAQELIDIGAVRSAKDADLFASMSPDEMQRMLDVAALGATGGAVFGGAGRATVKIANTLQEKFAPGIIDDGSTPFERFQRIMDKLPEGQRQEFARSQKFDNFEEMAAWMEANGSEQANYDSVDVAEYGELDDVQKAKVSEIFYKGQDGIPWPSVELWQAADPTGKKTFVDGVQEAYRQAHFSDPVSQRVYEKALADGYTREEAFAEMELQSPFSIQSGLDLAKKRADKNGTTSEIESRKIIKELFAKWPQFQVLAKQRGLSMRDILNQVKYIEQRRTTEAAPFTDVGLTADEVVERGEHTIFRKAGWDVLKKKAKVAKNQLPIELKKGDKTEVVGLDLQSLINSTMRKARGLRKPGATNIERFAEAMFAGIASLYVNENVNAERLTFTLENMTQAQKERLVAYKLTDGRSFSYADLERASKTTNKSRTDIEKLEKKIARLRVIDNEITRLLKLVATSNLTIQEKDLAQAAARTLMEKNPTVQLEIDFAVDELAELKVKAAYRDQGQFERPDIEEVEDPFDMGAEKMKPIYGGKPQLAADVTEERYEKRESEDDARANTHKSSSFFPEDDISFSVENGEINNTDWVAHEGFQHILKQAGKITAELGLEGKVQVLTPQVMEAMKRVLGAEFYNGALRGQAFTADSLISALRKSAEASGLDMESVKQFYKEDTGIDLDASDYFVYVNPKLSRKNANTVLAHEIGHIVLYDGFKKGTITDNIIDEYNNWLNYIRDQDPLVREILKDRAELAVESMHSSMLNLRVSDFIENRQAAAAINYMLNFHEWFADRVRNRLLDPKPPVGAFEKALEVIVNQLRKIFKLGVVIENTVEDYTEALMKNSNSNAWNTPNEPHEVLQAWRDEIQATRNATMTIDEQERFDENTFKMVAEFVKRTTGHRLSPAEFQSIVDMTTMHKHDVLGAAFNRSFRYIFKKGNKTLLNDAEKVIVSNAMNTAYVKRQVADLLRNSPEAWEDAKNDRDAMAAYAYQFWITGQVKLAHKTTGVFQKIFDFFKDLLGIVLESENAEMLLNEFTTGNAYLRSQNVREAQFHVKAAARDTMIQRAVHDHLAPAWEKISNTKFGNAVFSTANTRLFKTRNQWLIKLATMVFAPVGSQFAEEDMMNARTRLIARFHNEIFRVFKGTDKEFGQATIKILNEGRKFTKAEMNVHSSAFEALSQEEQAAVHVRHTLNEMHDYMTEAGMNIGLRENYFPWVFDEEFLGEHYDEFVDLLSAPEFEEEMAKANLTPDGVARAIFQSRGYADTGVARDDIGHTPAFSAMNERVLGFIDEKGTPAQRAKLAEFFSENLGHTLTTYIEQAVKRTEFNKRFGGNKLKNILEKAAEHGATDEQLTLAKTYMDAVMGTHGYETNRKLSELLELDPPAPGEVINHKLRRTMGIAMVYQNIRVLSLATLTSLVDPVGIAVRTGDMGIAWQSFRKGMSVAFQNADGDNAVLLDMAEMLGIVDRHMTAEALNWEYGGVYMTGMEKKINEGFFNLIGLQAWTRATRVMGLEGGLRFIGRHVVNPNQHSERFLAELDLRPEDVILDENGKVRVLTAAERRSSSQEEVARDDKIRAALHRFVDGAILRPNAALRPIWASDPHFMLIFHLKSFMYAFHEQILKRVVLEAANGHLTPILMFGLFIPFMIAADEFRELIQFGGDGNPQKAQWDVMDHIGSAVERSGMLGLGQIVADAGQDIKYGGLGYESYSGPTAQQAEDIFLEENYDWVKASPFQTVTKHYWETE